jgi:hypothetical protein
LVGCTAEEERKAKREKSRRGRRERKRVRAKSFFSFLFFFWVNWSYFTMGLLYCGLILETLNFYGKICLALFKKYWALS